jgi:hypothetical protein
MTRIPAVVAALLAFAVDGAAAFPVDPDELIGMDPAQAFAALGAPAGVFAQRGAVAAEDDVVFFYVDCCYVFWTGNRIWQVSYDRRYAGRVLGFAIGMGRAEAEAVTPGRLREADGSLYLSVDSGRFPVRVRLVMTDGRVTDIYVYRSDW